MAHGSISITTIANHAQYQLPTHADALDALLASRNFTHGYFWPAHYPGFFDAQCRNLQHGTPPDPSKVGDRVEEFCDPAEAACVARSPLLRTIQRHVPNLGVKGGLALRRAVANMWWMANGSARTGVDSTAVDRVEARYHDDPLIAQRRGPPQWNQHACNVICARRGRLPWHDGDVSCEPAEGTALAWEVLRSAGLLQCPSWWKGCDDLDAVKANREPFRGHLRRDVSP